MSSRGWHLGSEIWTSAGSSPLQAAARSFHPWGVQRGVRGGPSLQGCGAEGQATLLVSLAHRLLTGENTLQCWEEV